MLHFEVLLHYSIGGIWDVVHHDVEVDLIRLFTVGVEALPHFDAIWVMEHLEDGELSVLISFILEYFLDGHSFSSFSDSGFEYHTK